MHAGCIILLVDMHVASIVDLALQRKGILLACVRQRVAFRQAREVLLCVLTLHGSALCGSELPATRRILDCVVSSGTNDLNADHDTIKTMNDSFRKWVDRSRFLLRPLPRKLGRLLLGCCHCHKVWYSFACCGRCRPACVYPCRLLIRNGIGLLRHLFELLVYTGVAEFLSSSYQSLASSFPFCRYRHDSLLLLQGLYRLLW